MPLHSAYCLLLGEDGARFTDESQGDHRNTQAVLAQPRAKAILVADGEIHRTRVLSEYIPGLPRIDRLQVAADAGARFAKAESLGELAEAVVAWGVDGAACLRTLTRYNELARDEQGLLDPPRLKHAKPLETPPPPVLRARGSARRHLHPRRPTRRCRLPGVGEGRGDPGTPRRRHRH